MQVKTEEATKLQLDWGLANATGKRVRYYLEYNALAFDDCEDNLYLFSHTDPAVCMGLTAHLHIMQQATDGSWRVAGRRQGSSHVICKTGLTLPEAVARCVIAMRLGEVFEVPDELGVQS